MIQDERVNDNEQALRRALEGWQAGLWTACVGIVESYDSTAGGNGTVSVTPAIKLKVTAPDGSFTWQKATMLTDVPVAFFGAGGFTITVPITQGDECLLVFGARCINSWFEAGGVQVPEEMRMHDPSDAIAIFGLKSKLKTFSGISATSLQIRSDDGALYLELTAGNACNIVAPGGVNITGDVTVTGTLTATGEVTAAGGHTVSAHKHGGVSTGSGQTATPTG